MKKGILYYVVNNRKITLFATVIVLIMGIFSYQTSIKKEAPDFEMPIAMVMFSYLGANATEINEVVSKPIEDEFKQLDGYMTSTTNSFNNGGFVLVEFEYDVDRDESFKNVREILSDMERSLPEEVEVGTIITGVLEVTDFIYILTSTKDYEGDNDAYVLDLENKAIQMRERLSNLSYVNDVKLQGTMDTSIDITLDNNEQAQMSLTKNQLEQLLKSYDYSLPAGNTNEYIVQNKSPMNSKDDLLNIPIAIHPVNQSIIHLEDVTTIEENNSRNIITSINGLEGVIVYGYFDKNIDQLSFNDDFKKEIDDIEGEMGDAYSLQEIVYYPEDVKESNNSFFMSLLIGVLLVLLISFLTMGFRNAIVVSFALPTSIFLTLTVMRFLNIQLHQVSIAALIISIGMLVDNAIVVTESIKSKLEAGIEKLEATLQGTREVMIPVLTSTVTTIVAFSPLLFIPSTVGDYIKSIPQVIIISLTASYLVSITLMPCLSYIVFNKEKAVKGTHKIIGYIGKGMEFFIRRKWLVFVTILGLSILSISLVPRIGLAFFPAADKDFFYINITNKDGLGVGETVEKVGEVEAFLDKEQHVVSYATSVGSGFPRFWDTMRQYNDAVNFAQIMVTVDLGEDFGSNREYIDEIRNEMASIDDSLQIEIKELEKGEPYEAPITIKVTGSSTEGLSEAKNYTKELLKNIEGTAFVRDTEALDIPIMSIQYDMEKLMSYSLVLPYVQKEVTSTIHGSKVLEINGKQVYIKGNIGDAKDLNTYYNIIVGSYEAAPVTLKDVATIETKLEKSSLETYNGDYVITVLAEVEAGYSSKSIMDEFDKVLKEEQKKADFPFTSIKWLYEGEQESISNNFGDLLLQGVFAVFLILIVLMLQFNSFRQTLIILAVIPIAALGAIFGLYLTGYPLSFTALLGIVSLMGIVVNNAILLVDSMNQRKGPISERIIVGATRRIRPILLTTITTIFGLIPLIASGSEMFSPMAITIASGLIFSTLITLLLIPILYKMMFKDKKERIERKDQQEKNSEAEILFEL